MSVDGLSMTSVVPKFRQSTGCIAAMRAVIVALGLGVALGACSKCDVPNLLPHQAAPQSCNDAPPPQ